MVSVNVEDERKIVFGVPARDRSKPDFSRRLLPFFVFFENVFDFRSETAQNGEGGLQDTVLNRRELKPGAPPVGKRVPALFVESRFEVERRLPDMARRVDN